MDVKFFFHDDDDHYSRTYLDDWFIWFFSPFSVCLLLLLLFHIYWFYPVKNVQTHKKPKCSHFNQYIKHTHTHRTLWTIKWNEKSLKSSSSTTSWENHRFGDVFFKKKFYFIPNHYETNRKKSEKISGSFVINIPITYVFSFHSNKKKILWPLIWMIHMILGFFLFCLNNNVNHWYQINQKKSNHHHWMNRLITHHHHHHPMMMTMNHKYIYKI